MEKCGCFFWKMRNAWWERHWRFDGHGIGYAASGLAGVASACRLRPGGRCGKCLVFEMLAVLARPRGRDAWGLGARKRSSCRLRFGARVGSGCGLAGEMMRVHALRLSKRIVDLPFKPCVASCWVVSARKCHKGASLQACCSDEMGNSALKIFATCGFAVAVSDCSSWGA